MIDINFIRENPERVKEIVKKRSDPEKADIDKWLLLDTNRVSLIKRIDEVNHQKNKLAKLGANEQVEENRSKSKELKKQGKDLEKSLREVTKEWQEVLDWIPNIPFEDMPEGEGEEDNAIIKAWTPENGYIKEAVCKKARGVTEKLMPDFPIHAEEKDFQPKHHQEIGEKLGIIDKAQAAKVSGTRFTYLIGDLVLMQYAIERFVMDALIEKGFTPIVPPILVKSKALYGSSHFPESIDQIYAIQTDYVEDNNQLYLLGSTEPANFAYYMDKVLDEKELPVKLVAYAPAFRSEVGSWGKDTKGIKRLHQFDKIEMDVVCTPEQSEKIFDELLNINEWLLQELKLPYQLALKCFGDAGYHASAKQVDPEIWLAGQKEFMEMGTDTNATDFQARRLNIKYKDKDGKKRYVHTVNDTGVAMGRILIAILDHYQQKDGSILVPEVLRDYMGKDRITK